MTETPFGFKWGPLEVQRTCIIRGSHVMRVITEHHELEISVSPMGKSVVVFLDNDKVEKS